MEKILSFIIPSYNSQGFLDTCIPSFAHEKVLGELDIIIVNDGSQDDTAAVAEKYCRMYPGSVRLISQENKGHGGALNTGCAAAAGKYLKVIDADDWVITENLPAFVGQLRDCSADVVLTHYHMNNITTDEVTAWKSFPGEFGRSYSFREIMERWKDFDRVLTFHGITYRTDFYREKGIQLSEHVFYEDHEFATIPCCYAREILPLDLFVYEYRVGDVQQSVSDENQLKRIGHTRAVLERLIREYAVLDLQPEDAGREYYCMKTQGLLLSYYITALLVEKNKKKGRAMADTMMARFREEMPRVHELSRKQYRVFRAMNRLHLSKNAWEKIKSSEVYNALRHNHDFS